MHSNIAHPMRLTVGVDQACKLVEQIPHDMCRSAAERHWNVADDRTVPEESVNWLFCWGKTGMGSRSAAEKAKRVFDASLPISFSCYDHLVDHEYARTHRYIAEDRSVSHRLNTNSVRGSRAKLGD
jgi:hypothetical protein